MICLVGKLIRVYLCLSKRRKALKSQLKFTVMDTLKVVKIDKSNDLIEFEDGTKLYSNHDQDCCENHYLSLSDLNISDFDGLEFDLKNDDFFERVEGFGIALKPINGHPVRIAGHGSNNGYYSDKLDLILENGKEFYKKYDISECQNIKD